MSEGCLSRTWYFYFLHLTLFSFNFTHVNNLQIMKCELYNRKDYHQSIERGTEQLKNNANTEIDT